MEDVREHSDTVEDTFATVQAQILRSIATLLDERTPSEASQSPTHVAQEVQDTLPPHNQRKQPGPETTTVDQQPEALNSTQTEVEQIALSGPPFPEYLVVLCHAHHAFLITTPTKTIDCPRTVRLRVMAHNAQISIGCTIQLSSVQLKQPQNTSQGLTQLIIKPDGTPFCYAEATTDDIHKIKHPEPTDIAGIITPIPYRKGRMALDIVNPRNGQTTRLTPDSIAMLDNEPQAADTIALTFITYPSGTWCTTPSRDDQYVHQILLPANYVSETDDLRNMHQLLEPISLPTAARTLALNTYQPITQPNGSSQFRTILQHLLAAGTYANSVQQRVSRSLTRFCKVKMLQLDRQDPDWLRIRLTVKNSQNHTTNNATLRHFQRGTRIAMQPPRPQDATHAGLSGIIETRFSSPTSTILIVKINRHMASQHQLAETRKLLIFLQELRRGTIQKNLSISCSALRPTNYHLVRTLLGVKKARSSPMVIPQALQVILENELDESQLEAALAALNDSHTVIDILAHAGSGKSRTTVLIALALLALHHEHPLTVILMAATNQGINNSAIAINKMILSYDLFKSLVRAVILSHADQPGCTSRVPQLTPNFQSLSDKLDQLRNGKYGQISPEQRTILAEAIGTDEPRRIENATPRRAWKSRQAKEAVQVGSTSLQQAFILLAQRSRINLVIATLDTLAIHHTFISALSQTCLILDDANSVSEMRLFETISQNPNCKQVIQVGDLRQFGPHNTLRQTPLTEPLTQSAMQALQRRGSSIQKTVHFSYRAHPMLTLLASNAYYNGEMRSAIKTERRSGLTAHFPLSNQAIPFIAVHHPGQSRITDEGSRENLQQCEIAIRVAQAIYNRHQGNMHVAILTAYRGDKEKTLELLRLQPHLLHSTYAETIDSFRGREEQIVILVLGIEGELLTTLDHINNTERAVVALTRAKHGYILVSDIQFLLRNVAFAPYLHQLALNNMQFHTSVNLHLCLLDRPFTFERIQPQPIPLIPQPVQPRELIKDLEAVQPDL